MKKPINPFLLKGYRGPAYFCGREKETGLLIENAKNGINTTLLSIRRMGKTGLIHHAFKQLEKDKNYKGIYVDIYATQHLADFTNRLASAILGVFPQNKSIGQKFIELITRFSPVISYDAYTGVPEITLSVGNEHENKRSLTGLFQFLENQKQHILIAIDEFQQISHYPEKNTEAILRTAIQPLNEVSFIFSGSHKHMLIEMFNSAKRPFFSSTQPLNLTPIAEKKYTAFIKKLLKKHGKSISNNAVAFILEWTCNHTYYTQALCNKLFSITDIEIGTDDVLSACDHLLKEQEVVFFQYRNLLTLAQWNLLKAIAKEQTVNQPTASAFTGKYQLGNPASVRRSLEALLQKEMIYAHTDSQGNNNYRVYDCFLSRWLAKI